VVFKESMISQVIIGYQKIVCNSICGGDVMKLNTHYFGELEVRDDQIINFVNGLKGFEDMKRFAIINNYDTEEPVPFFWLQSLENPDLAFVLTVPFIFKPDYAFDLSNETQEALHITKDSELGIYSIVTIPGEIKDFTYNLMGPIVVNYTTREGDQVVLYNENFSLHENFKS
jgi:flagellar assembly factor FliW